MKKLLFVALLSMGFAGYVRAQSTERDTVARKINMEAVKINGTRATAKTPLTYSNMSREAIEKLNTGQDIPFLLITTPSVVTTSDAGAGIGYTTIRVRGTDPTRINVTANDVPIADAESHSQFWVNVPDLAASMEDMQIQRGVGSSTNGAGAFGASINIRTLQSPFKATATAEGAYGSFNTHREMASVSSGLIGGHFAFDARLSNIHSDGYIDRATTDLQSYFIQGGYYGKSTTVRFITFSGREKTYHAWNGIDREMLETNRRYNPAGEIEDRDGKVIGFYDNQTDNYHQTHYQLLFTQRLAPRWDLDIKLHYTDGTGYYEEYKNRRTLSEYGLAPFEFEGELVKKSNLVRRKSMENGFGGGVVTLNYHAPKIDVTLAGAANQYGGMHHGTVIWAQNYVGNWQPDHEYYRNTSTKNDANVYLKANYQVLKELSLYADLQYRHVDHTIGGANDNWDFNTGAMQELDVRRNFDFFNPKAGLFYQPHDKHSLYGSFAVAHKEPTRNNYTDASTAIPPKAERMYDTELGYNFRSKKVSASATLYYMDYKDQLVLTGRTNDIGEPLTENVARSYRMGVELSAGWQIIPCLRLDVTGTLSSNKILDYTEYVDDYDENWEPLYTQTANYVGLTDISFSPSLTAAGVLAFDMKGWNATLIAQYVGEQYLNNSMQKGAMLDSYFVSNLMLSYTFKWQTVKALTLGVTVNNIFNEMYESNGWASSSYIIAPDGSRSRENYAGFFPQAGTNVMGRIMIRF